MAPGIHGRVGKLVPSGSAEEVVGSPAGAHRSRSDAKCERIRWPGNVMWKEALVLR